MLNKVKIEEVIIEVSLIATKGFYNKSDKVNKGRANNKRRLVKTI